MSLFISPAIEKLIELAFLEDLLNDDITTLYTVLDQKKIEAKIVAKEDLVFCGTPIVKPVLDRVDKNIEINFLKQDGEFVKKGEKVLTLNGYASSILKSERILLNFLQRMSGIATKSRKYVKILNNDKIKIVDTRKTLPGFRSLDKYSVKMGGAFNHRLGLSDGIMIKDNHIVASGSIKKAVENVRKHAPHTMKIEVEVTNLSELKEALDAKADIVMLDNMDTETMKKAIKIIDKKAIIEVSGNVTEERLPELSELDIDIISTGALTHSVTAADLSMKF